MSALSITDTIGKALEVWGGVEKAKQEARLAETRNQAALYGIPSQSQNPQAKSQNPQAKAGGDTSQGALKSLAGNPVAVVGGLAIAGLLAWWLMR